MGTLYRRQVRYCTTCARRLDTRAALHACTTAGHIIEARDQPIWWIKYQVGGRPQCVSSHSERKEDAKRLLKTREGDVVRGVPITASTSRVSFEDAAADLISEYKTNGRRSLRTVELRIRKHLTPFFGRRRLMTITTSDVRAFTAKRQAGGAANASINRDLVLLKRMCKLAIQAGKLMVQPYIPLLKENNISEELLRDRAVYERPQPPARPHAGDRRLREHHGLADAERDPAPRVAPGRHEGRGGSARRRFDQERG